MLVFERETKIYRENYKTIAEILKDETFSPDFTFEHEDFGGVFFSPEKGFFSDSKKEFSSSFSELTDLVLGGWKLRTYSIFDLDPLPSQEYRVLMAEDEMLPERFRFTPEMYLQRQNRFGEWEFSEVSYNDVLDYLFVPVTS